MIQYVHEVLPTGEIVSSTKVVEGAPQISKSGGSFIVADTEYIPGKGYYSNGSFHVIPESPDPIMTFNYESLIWEDPRSLEQLKTDKWAEIKTHRDAEEFGPFVYNGMTFDGDADAQRRLMVYISVSKSALSQGIEFSLEFTLANNTEVMLQANDFVAIELAKANQVAAVFAKAALLRQQITEASSKEELEAISWDTVTSE